ncbi:terminase small subunit [Lysinibacillus fusiformis]|uniref:terminase small subunit n=1 Tax=Lysinibacillus fusiformis TaxID=28031 RepID=UPI002E20366D|nr:terminase small subunit [Lysinibacillus fusiformis]
MANWDEIKLEWETTKITLAKLAEKHDVPLGTIKSQKSRDTKNGNPWVRDANKKDATKTKKVATLKEDASDGENSDDIIYFDAEGEDGLTDKQRLFCMYYIKTYNQTMAAIKAGYAKDSAHVEGSRLLRNAKVANEIRRLKGEIRKGIFVDAMDVLDKYIQIAFADITDYLTFGQERVQLIGAFGPVFDKDDKPVMVDQGYVRFNESIDVDGTLVTEVKQGRDGLSVKFADKMRALDFLAKHFDLLNERERKQLEVEKAKASLELSKIAIRKENGEDDDEFEDDGFLEALEGKEVNWDE